MKKQSVFLLCAVSLAFAAKAQMTVGGNYKPSHTLVVKGQVKIDTVKVGTTADSILTIGNDSVLHKLPYSAFTTATTNSLSLSGNSLTSNVNGIAASSGVIGGVSNASTANTLQTTVNGVTGTAATIINSHTGTWTQSNGLSISANGVTANITPAGGTAANLLGYNATGAPVYQSASGVLAGATTNSLSLSGNSLTSTVNGAGASSSVIGGVSNTSSINALQTTINGITGTAVPIINTHTGTWTQTGGLSISANGVTATVTPASGSASNLLGYTSQGTPVYQSVSGVLGANTTNTLSSSGNNMTSSVNGVSSTPPTPIINANTLSLSGNILTSSVNGITGSTGVIGGVSNTSSVNTLSTTVNGVTGTAVPIINSNTLSSSGNSMISSVNGVSSAPATPIINTNALSNTKGVLTSTVNGVASNGTPVLISASNGLTVTNGDAQLAKTVLGTLPATNSTIPLSANTYTGASITLPPGKWAVNVNMIIVTNNSNSGPNIPVGASVWAKSSFSESSSAYTLSSDIIGTAKQVSGGGSGPVDYGMLSGTLLINNSSNANKIYYYWQLVGIAYSPLLVTIGGVSALGATSTSSTLSTRLVNFGTSAWSEDQIIAVPVNY